MRQEVPSKVPSKNFVRVLTKQRFYPTHHPLSAIPAPHARGTPASPDGTPSIDRCYLYGWVRYSLADITIYASQISLLSFHSSERRQNKPSQLSRIAQRSLRLSF